MKEESYKRNERRSLFIFKLMQNKSINVTKKTLVSYKNKPWLLIGIFLINRGDILLHNKAKSFVISQNNPSFFFLYSPKKPYTTS